MEPILSQMYPIHTFTAYFFKIRFNIILPSTFDLPSGPFPSGFPTVHHNIIWYVVKIMKLLIIQVSKNPSTSSFLSPNIFLNTSCSQTFYIYKTTGEGMSLKLCNSGTEFSFILWTQMIRIIVLPDDGSRASFRNFMCL
jgi:hypothetical protein